MDTGSVERLPSVIYSRLAQNRSVFAGRHNDFHGLLGSTSANRYTLRRPLPAASKTRFVLEFRRQYGGVQTLVLMLRVKTGDIYNFKTLHDIRI
jgi:hypothetical protein